MLSFFQIAIFWFFTQGNPYNFIYVNITYVYVTEFT